MRKYAFKRLLKDANLDQKTFARLAGVSANTVSRWNDKEEYPAWVERFLGSFDKGMTLDKCKDQLKEVFLDNLEDIKESDYPEDFVNELIDDCIPVYHSEQFDVLNNDRDLLDILEESGAGLETDLYKNIATAIYLHLSNYSCELIYEHEIEA